MDQSERLRALINELLESPHSFAIGIGLPTAATVYDILNNKRPISPAILKKIVSSYPHLNPEWLLKGTPPKLLTGRPEEKPSELVAEAGEKYEAQTCKLCKEKDKEIAKLNTKLIDLQEQYIDCLKEISGLKKISSG